MISIMPIGDSEPGHIYNENCPCGPRVEHAGDGSVIVIHNSFDGREAVEKANEILGNNPEAN